MIQPDPVSVIFAKPFVKPSGSKMICVSGDSFNKLGELAMWQIIYKNNLICCINLPFYFCGDFSLHFIAVWEVCQRLIALELTDCLSLYKALKLFFTEDDDNSKPEALNKKALQIVKRVKDKLTGLYRRLCRLQMHPWFIKRFDTSPLSIQLSSSLCLGDVSPKFASNHYVNSRHNSLKIFQCNGIALFSVNNWE